MFTFLIAITFCSLFSCNDLSFNVLVQALELFHVGIHDILVGLSVTPWLIVMTAGKTSCYVYLSLGLLGAWGYYSAHSAKKKKEKISSFQVRIQNKIKIMIQ